MAIEATIAPAPEMLPFRSIRTITRRYYCVWGFYAFAPSFIFAIYPLFLRSRGLNQFQVNTVAANYFLVTFLTDVPTGAFADAIGRRVSVVLGCALHAAAFILYFYSYHYWHFLVAEIIDGVATTFGNGAIDAWAVDALDAAGFEGAKDRIFSRVAQILRIGAMTGALVGAYSARIDLASRFRLGTIGWLVAGAVGLILMDGPTRTAKQFSIRAMSAEVRQRMFAGTRSGFSTRAVFLISLAEMFSAAAWFPFWQEWQPYFHARLGSGVEVMGWIFCLFSIAQIAGAEIVSRMRWAREERALYVMERRDQQCGLVGGRIGRGPGRLRIRDVHGCAILGRREHTGHPELIQRGDRGRQSRDAAFVRQHVRDFRCDRRAARAGTDRRQFRDGFCLARRGYARDAASADLSCAAP